MTKLNIYNQEGKVVGEMELNPKFFGVAIQESLLHQAVVTQMGNMRKVIADTKDKSEVSGGGKKPWRQKGTGRARVGSSRSPIWRGGGITFGPTNDRNFKQDLNKKMSRKAMFMALSDKAMNGQMALLENLDLKEFKTKTFISMLKEIATNAWKDEKKVKRSTLLINNGNSEQAKYSARNLTNVTLLNLDNINIFDLMNHENLILTVDAVKTLEARYK